MLGQKLLYFPCRHHIFELILSAVFARGEGFTTSPDIPVFKRFQREWKNIDTNIFETGIEDQLILNAVHGSMQDILDFIKNQLSASQAKYIFFFFILYILYSHLIFSFQKSHARKDYKEFLELVSIFLGGYKNKEIKFKQPGAMHRARWMSKAIYCLKIWMFRKQFCLTPQEEKLVREICLFVVVVYAKFWFLAPLPSSAPNNDLLLLKALERYVLQIYFFSS